MKKTSPVRQLKLDEMAFKGVEISMKIKPLRRLSFMDTPYRGGVSRLDKELEEAFVKMTVGIPGGGNIEPDGWKSTIKNRIPTPYPKEANIEDEGYFGLREAQGSMP